MDKAHTSATHRTVQRRLSGIEVLRRAFVIAQAAAHRLADETHRLPARAVMIAEVETTVHDRAGS
jgi:hypothetical protein